MTITYVMVECVFKNGIRYNICEICDTEFRPRIKGKGNLYRRTCSPGCELELKSKVQSKAWTQNRRDYMSRLFTGRDVSKWNFPKRENHPRWKGGKTPMVYRRIAFEDFELDAVCSSCGSIEEICVHHKDGNRSNNTKENLLIFCKPCYTSFHDKNGDTGFGSHDYNQCHNIPRIGVEDLNRELSNGKSIRCICREYGTNHHTLGTMMKKYNIVKPKKEIITIEQVRQHLLDGKSVRWINKEYEIRSHTLVPDIIKNNNIVIPSRKYMKPKKEKLS